MLEENKIPRLAIYYIATSNYKVGFESFNKNLHCFYPEFNKTVVILSDGLTEWDKVVSKNPEGTEINYEVYYIDHFCWPIIALFKMKLILDHKVDCDYACYFNANIEFNPDFDWSTINKLIDITKFNSMRHFWSGNRLLDGFIFDKRNNEGSTLQHSISFINSNYTYAQSGFFFGPSNIVYSMCKEVSEMIEKDLSKNVIPNYHDESYLNKWILDNSIKCSELKRLILKREKDKDYPFILNDDIKKLH